MSTNRTSTPGWTNRRVFLRHSPHGRLTRTTNQPGFDVIANGRKISVKTTAQTTGFVSINQNTFQKFDDLFLVQYKEDDFTVIYYGPKEEVLDIARTYNHCYEIEIKKLIKKEKGKII